MIETTSRPSLNAITQPLVEALARDAALLGVTVRQGGAGERVIDAGAATPGGLEAGLAVAAIAMGGLAPWTVAVRSSRPVLACLASQYAGWHLSDDQERNPYSALGSGPARALAAREKLFEELGYKDFAGSGTLVVEGEHAPPPAVVAEVARACGIPPACLTILLVPVHCLAGSVQVAARALETAMGKAHRAGFPFDRILDGLASAPLAPPHPEPAQAMVRTNEAMIYGGRVQLFVDGPAADARALAEHLPSSAARDPGTSFAETLAAAGGDFYALDQALFGPAEASVTALRTGETFRFGAVHPAHLARALG
jgi:methenyltetrahydromethanopterin cyclohydrolase